MPKAATVVQMRVEPAQVKAKAGGAATATLVAQVQEGFHINSNQPLESYLIPSRVELVEAPAFSLDKINYPKGELKTFDFAPDEKLSVYEGTLTLPLRLQVSAARRAAATPFASPSTTRPATTSSASRRSRRKPHSKSSWSSGGHHPGRKTA
jgi:hypothetical protein